MKPEHEARRITGIATWTVSCFIGVSRAPMLAIRHCNGSFRTTNGYT